MKMQIIHPDEESIVVKLNGKEVARANHDQDGWAGIEKVEQTAIAIAKVAGWTVVQK